MKRVLGIAAAAWVAAAGSARARELRLPERSAIEHCTIADWEKADAAC